MPTLSFLSLTVNFRNQTVWHFVMTHTNTHSDMKKETMINQIIFFNLDEQGKVGRALVELLMVSE